MKRLFILVTISIVLAAMQSLSWAGSNLNSSKSNTYRVVYDTTIVNPAQASAILADLDRAGRTVGAGQVTEIIKRHGVQVDRVKKIVIRPSDKIRKETTILLLTNPADEAQALAVSDEGASGLKEKPKK